MHRPMLKHCGSRMRPSGKALRCWNFNAFRLNKQRLRNGMANYRKQSMPEHRFRFYRLASSMKELDDVKAAARDLWRKLCKKPGYIWPDCPPPDEKCQYLGCNINGINYKQSEVSPGRWQWIVNEEAEKYAREQEARRTNLYWALRSRVLTDEEMAEVETYGRYLNIQPMTPYSAHEKELDLNAALLQQFRLREIAKAANK